MVGWHLISGMRLLAEIFQEIGRRFLPSALLAEPDGNVRYVRTSVHFEKMANNEFTAF